MRIIAGRFKGRKLYVPGKGVRPTTDRVRESLFAILGDMDGDRVVDLFAGAGTLGFEALSRGAAEAHFVDRGRAALAILERNLEPAREAGLPVTVHARSVRSFLGAHWPEEPVDLVFMDPPYGDPEGPACLRILAEKHGARIGRVIYECEGREDPPIPEGLERERELDYGDSKLILLRGGARP